MAKDKINNNSTLEQIQKMLIDDGYRMLVGREQEILNAHKAGKLVWTVKELKTIDWYFVQINEKPENTFSPDYNNLPIYVVSHDTRSAAEAAVLAAQENGRDAVVLMNGTQHILFRVSGKDLSWSGVYNDKMRPTTGRSPYSWEPREE